jgi:hypothetical protein
VTPERLAEIDADLAGWRVRCLEQDTLADLARELLAEVKRLLRGDFAPEEFQALCHHWEERAVSREEFEAGCREYQAKLFGGAT